MSFTKLGLCQCSVFIVCKVILLKKSKKQNNNKKKQFNSTNIDREPSLGTELQGTTHDSQESVLVLTGRMTGSRHILSKGREGTE